MDWLAVDSAYKTCAAVTYGGLFKWLLNGCFLGQLDPAGTFIVLLTSLSLPVWVFTPRHLLTKPLVQPSAEPSSMQHAESRALLLVAAGAFDVGLATLA